VTLLLFMSDMYTRGCFIDRCLEFVNKYLLSVTVYRKN